MGRNHQSRKSYGNTGASWATPHGLRLAVGWRGQGVRAGFLLLMTTVTIAGADSCWSLLGCAQPAGPGEEGA